MTDDVALDGVDAGYVPCGDAASPAVVEDSDGNAVAGEGGGYIEPGDLAASSPSDDNDAAAISGTSAGFVAKPCDEGVCYLNIMAPSAADRGATGTCVQLTKHERSSAYPASVPDFIHMQLWTFTGSTFTPRLTSQWVDTNVTGHSDRVSDDEGYSVLSYVNPLFATTGATRARLTAELRASMPSVLGVPEDQPLIDVPWTLYACDMGDPKTTYGLSGSTPVSITIGAWDDPGGAVVVASGVHPGGDQVVDIDVSWTVANPEWIQFFLRSYATQGSDPDGNIMDRLFLSAGTPDQWVAGVTAYDQPNRGSPNLNTHVLYVCP